MLPKPVLTSAEKWPIICQSRITPSIAWQYLFYPPCIRTSRYLTVQGPSASAYVTFSTTDAALKCIQMVHGLTQDGRTLKATLGTTKYCSRFLNGQQCKLTDCMYLHEIADPDASFTKEDMQKQKHTGKYFTTQRLWVKVVFWPFFGQIFLFFWLKMLFLASSVVTFRQRWAKNYWLGLFLVINFCFWPIFSFYWNNIILYTFNKCRKSAKKLKRMTKNSPGR